MAPKIKHNFASAKADTADTTLIQPSHWNEDHSIQAAAKTLLGRPDNTAGEVKEITVGSGLSLSDDGELTAPPQGEATSAAAGLISAADKTKLDGIAANATANAPDTDLRARATHTGAQAISTVTGLQTALDAKAPLNSPAFTGTPTVGGDAVVTGKVNPVTGVVVNTIVNLTQAQYDSLAVKDANTLYVIVG